MKYLVVLLLLIGAGFWLYVKHGERVDQEQTTAQARNIKPSDSSTPKTTGADSDLNWLRKVKNKPLKTKDILNLQPKWDTTSYTYDFKIDDMKAGIKSKNGRAPFHFVGGLYSGKKGTTLQPNYDGRATIFIVDKETKRVVKRKTLPLRGLCYT